MTTVILIAFFIIALGLDLDGCNGGLLYVKQRSRPTDYIITILGSNSVSNDNWALLTFQDGMMRDTREMLMPNLMNSMRLPDFIALRRYSLLWSTILSVSVTLCVSAYAFLALTYEKGGLNLETYAYVTAAIRPFDQFRRHMITPTEASMAESIVVVIGAGMMSGLMYFRRKFLWWRLHPIGYLMHLSGASSALWASIFWGWFCKLIVLKIGGIGSYRRFRPLLLGLVLGESFIGGIWIVVGLFTGIGYRILPS